MGKVYTAKNGFDSFQLQNTCNKPYIYKSYTRS